MESSTAPELSGWLPRNLSPNVRSEQEQTPQTRQIESNFIIFFIVVRYLEVKIDTYTINFNQWIGTYIVS